MELCIYKFNIISFHEKWERSEFKNHQDGLTSYSRKFQKNY